MRKVLGGIGLSLMCIASGCTDYSSIQDEVISSNQRTQTVLSNYEETKKESKSIGNWVVNSLKGEEKDSLTFHTEVEDTRGKLDEAIDSLHDKVITYIDTTNSLANEQKGDTSITSPIQPIEDTNDFIDSSVEEHLFMDGNTGKTEQMFIVELPDGFLGGVSVYWLGGSVLDVKTFGLD